MSAQFCEGHCKVKKYSINTNEETIALNLVKNKSIGT